MGPFIFDLGTFFTVFNPGTLVPVVLGGLVFGWFWDRRNRSEMQMMTLGLYITSLFFIIVVVTRFLEQLGLPAQQSTWERVVAVWALYTVFVAARWVGSRL